MCSLCMAQFVIQALGIFGSKIMNLFFFFFDFEATHVPLVPSIEH